MRFPSPTSREEYTVWALGVQGPRYYVQLRDNCTSLAERYALRQEFHEFVRTTYATFPDLIRLDKLPNRTADTEVLVMTIAGVHVGLIVPETFHNIVNGIE
jgi:hypothetical protein